MKRTIYTLGFVALLSLAGNAQDPNKKKADTTKDKKNTEVKSETIKVETVNPDGTTTTVEQSTNGTSTVQVSPEPSQANTTETAPAKKSGTRSAITQKGTPGSSKAVKEEKAPTTVSTPPADVKPR